MRCTLEGARRRLTYMKASTIVATLTLLLLTASSTTGDEVLPVEHQCQVRLFTQSTIGIFIMKLPGGVTCRNTQPVADFSECRGYCPSRDTFNTIVNDFESTCKCCASKVTRDVQIQLSCDNGTPTMHTFRQPVSCECKTCNLESKDAGWEVPGAVPEKKRK